MSFGVLSIVDMKQDISLYFYKCGYENDWRVTDEVEVLDADGNMCTQLTYWNKFSVIFPHINRFCIIVRADGQHTQIYLCGVYGTESYRKEVVTATELNSYLTKHFPAVPYELSKMTSYIDGYLAKNEYSGWTKGNIWSTKYQSRTVKHMVYTNTENINIPFFRGMHVEESIKNDSGDITPGILYLFDIAEENKTKAINNKDDLDALQIKKQPISRINNERELISYLRANFPEKNDTDGRTEAINAHTKKKVSESNATMIAQRDAAQKQIIINSIKIQDINKLVTTIETNISTTDKDALRNPEAKNLIYRTICSKLALLLSERPLTIQCPMWNEIHRLACLLESHIACNEI